jgi:hypothetical protein
MSTIWFQGFGSPDDMKALRGFEKNLALLFNPITVFLFAI